MMGPVNAAPSGGLGQQGASADSQARAAQGRFEAPSVKLETAIAVEPPQKGAEASVLARELRRNLNPPDPNAPAGPPPSFDASILDRAMEELKSPPPPPEPDREIRLPDAVTTGDEVDVIDALVTVGGEEAAAEEVDAKDPYAVPPSAAVRAEREITEIRKIETPEQTGSVDLEL